MNMTRVVHISLGTHIGGMEKLLVQFARFADRDRYDLTFVSLQSRGELAEEIERQNWPFFAMGKTEGLKPRLVSQLAKRLRSIKPDVVHTHNTTAYLYGVAAAVIAGVPRIIHTRHGQRLNASRRQTMLFRILSPWVDRVVSVSNDGADLTVDEGISPSKTSTVFNGVDLDRFSATSNRGRSQALVVARLSPEKDIATLINAMHILKCRGAELTLDIVGDGCQRRSLESLTRSLGLVEAIHFHGARHDVPDFLTKASLFVLPSISEGISLTLLEAMATGLPVVACRVGGNPEVVDDGQTGLLVPPGNPEALSDAMLRLHLDQQRSGRMGAAGRERVESKFCIRKMVRSYEDLYLDRAA